MNLSRLLIFAPHADDAEFGVGGILAARKRLGIVRAEVAVCSLSGYDRGDGSRVAAGVRRAESDRALSFLGAEVVYHQLFEEQKALTADYETACRFMEEMIETSDPTTVLCCLPSFNQDHRWVADAFISATRPMGRMPAATVGLYEHPGNAWGPQPPASGWVYVRLTAEDLRRKIRALQMHRSQFAGREGHVAPAGAEILGLLRGSEIGAEAAERIYLLREVIAI